ncbi:MAG: hypothetical protein HFE86_00505 [Clostridiales bacterium]|nr:hypothetical protein [Clostridiales bacterium]
MNNLKYTRDSMAYDFPLFQPKERETPAAAPRRKENVVKMPVRQGAMKEQRKKATAKGMAGKLSAFLMAVLVLAMLCGSLYLRVEITEITDRIDKAEAVLEEQKSEEVRLLMEMERKVSYKNIEEAAQQLGMQKKERSQVNYIRTNPDSKGESAGQSGELWAQND